MLRSTFTSKKNAKRAEDSKVSYAAYEDMFSFAAPAHDDTLPDVFLNSDYVDFDFGSDLLPGGRPAKKPKKPASKPKRTSLGGPPARSAAAAPPPASQKSSESESFAEFAEDYASGYQSSISAASFEDVFGLNTDDFEFSNPATWDKTETKKAAFQVLAKTEDTAESKARKLFLLEQLQKPSPPSVPPSLKGAVAGGTLAVDAQATQELLKGAGADILLNNTRGRGKRKIRLKDYDMEQRARDKIDLKTYWQWTHVLLMTSFSLEIGWRVRVEICRDIALVVRLMHDRKVVHGDISLASILVDDDGRAHLKEAAKKVPKKKRDAKRKFDVLSLGALIYTACTLETVPPSLLKDLIRKEKAGKVDRDGIDVEKAQACSDLIRKRLEDSNTPGSLIELCVQATHSDPFDRPEAEDVWDWLDSVVEDLENSGLSKEEPDAAYALGASLSSTEGLKPVKSPKLVVEDVLLVEASAEDEEGEEEESEEGYETNDSFQPSPTAVATGSTFEKDQQTKANKLAAFLGDSTDSPKDRPVSMNVSALSKFSSFLASSIDNQSSGASEDVSVLGAQAKQEERHRRRSLDRGYMWARRKYADIGDTRGAARGPADKAAGAARVGKHQIGKFKEMRSKLQGSGANVTSPADLAEAFREQKLLSQEAAMALCGKAEMLMKKEPNMVELTPKLVIVGDIHGQFFDLLNLFSIAGELSDKKSPSYVFLGDYVDRGEFSCEVLLYLFSLKIAHPSRIFLLRGNHECRTVSSYFGFKQECEVKYGLTVFNKCINAFQSMPIAALVTTEAGNLLCCHGGISPNISSLAQFAEFDRFTEPGMSGFLCDLLWSDPVKDVHDDGSDMSLGDFLGIDFLPNPARGCSFRYGFKALVSFLAVNKLVAIVRAHEVQMGGFKYHFQELTGGKGETSAQVTPPVITVFSAPNYCGRYGNLGAYLLVNERPPGLNTKKAKKKLENRGYRPLELIEPIQFTQVEHPDAVQFESAQKSQELRIEQTCPYMPTTFHTFIKRALALAKEEEAMRRELERSSVRKSMARVKSMKRLDSKSPTALAAIAADLSEFDTTSINAISARRSVKAKVGDTRVLDSINAAADKRAAAAESAPVVPMPAPVDNNKKKFEKKFSKAAALLGMDGGSLIPEEKKPKKVVRKTMEQKRVEAKFDAAASTDGINEMNPTIVQEKMERAKNIIGVDVDESEDKALFKVGRSSVFDRSAAGAAAAALERKGSKQKISKIEENESGTSNVVEEEITFTSKELLALQMLFLLVDRKDRGFIDVADLVAWSAEEGEPVQLREAKMCLDAVDFDLDKKIGFEDYLQFAARAKDKWLVTNYTDVLRQVKSIRMAEGSIPPPPPPRF